MNKKFIVSVISFALLSISVCSAQGFYGSSDKESVSTETITTAEPSSGFMSRSGRPGDPPHPGDTGAPVGEGIAAFLALSGGYALFKSRNNNKKVKA